MTYEGIDTAARLTAAQAKILHDNGISFVARYLVPETLWKALTAQEAAAIRSAGLAVMLCWELGGEDLRGGSVKGVEHGARAKQLADAMGVPAGTIIYFAVDYNAPLSDYDPISEYLKAAQTALGAKYRAGVYGCYNVAEAMRQRVPGIPIWQCVAWSGGLWSAHARVRQYAWQGDSKAKALGAKVGAAVDLDNTQTLDGMWRPANVEYDDGDGGTIIEPVGADAPGGPQPWYAEAIQWAKDKGFINDGRPNDPVTRAELATVLFRIFGPEDNKTDSGLLSEE